MVWDIVLRVLGAMGVIGLLGTAIALALKVLIEKGIQHKFDEALEHIKSNLRLEEEKLKSTVAAEQARINSLQQLVLSGVSSRNQALDKRRLEAIERLWKGIVDMLPLRSIALATQSFRLDRIVDEATKKDSSGAKMREFAGLMLQMAGADKYTHDSNLDLERLYVPAVLWAKFSAYRQIMSAPFVRLMLAKGGLDATLLKDDQETLEVLKSLLPHAATYIDTWGISAISPLVDQLTTTIVLAFQDALINPEGDALSLKTANSLMAAVRAMPIAGSTAPSLPAVPDKSVLGSAPPPPPQ